MLSGIDREDLLKAVQQIEGQEAVCECYMIHDCHLLKVVSLLFGSSELHKNTTTNILSHSFWRCNRSFC